MARAKASARKSTTPKTNGTAHKASAPPKTPAKSPTQPPDLSEADRAQAKRWLDSQHNGPFTVAIQKPSLKRKRGGGNMQLETDLFEERLNVQYEVRPRDKWDCLRRYKKFTVGSESIATGQCVLVKPPDNGKDDADDAIIDIAAQWKAKVLEVRALDTEHVYLRVSWLNRPEDLSSGRKAYHGKNELIPTNQMDVIDAMAVNGIVDVMHWDETDDEKLLEKEDQYFWRQTFDYANTKTFSKLQTICIDDAPENPDEMIIQCGNKACLKWQHVKCIAEKAVKDAAGKNGDAKSKPRNDDPSAPWKTTAVARSEKNSFVAEVFIKDEPKGSERAAATTGIVITTPKGETRDMPVLCLFCQTNIE